MVFQSQAQRSIVMVRNVMRVRCEDLSFDQRKFILDNAPDPGDERAVVCFCHRFKSTYGFSIVWDKMRRLITKLRRKERRKGNGQANGSKSNRGPVRRHRSRRKVTAS